MRLRSTTAAAAAAAAAITPQLRTTPLTSSVRSTAPPRSGRPRRIALNAVSGGGARLTPDVPPEAAAALPATPEHPKRKKPPIVTPSSVSPKKQKKASSKEEKAAPTASFSALSAKNFSTAAGDVWSNVKVHTLILGTHPSIKSLQEDQYYGHPMNAFWWIVGDCLGFRRDTGVSPSTGSPYKFVAHLRHENVIPYSEQTKLLCAKGFALWDMFGECRRKGSLDKDIQEEVPNDIPAFCREHPTIRRIVVSNGGLASRLFQKHFKEWCQSGELVAAPNPESQNAFRFPKPNSFNRTISCISAISVSPAAARYSYQQKRDFWEEYVFRPGLQDFSEHHGGDDGK